MGRNAGPRRAPRSAGQWYVARGERDWVGRRPVEPSRDNFKDSPLSRPTCPRCATADERRGGRRLPATGGPRSRIQLLESLRRLPQRTPFLSIRWGTFHDPRSRGPERPDERGRECPHGPEGAVRPGTPREDLSRRRRRRPRIATRLADARIGDGRRGPLHPRTDRGDRFVDDPLPEQYRSGRKYPPLRGRPALHDAVSGLPRNRQAPADPGMNQCRRDARGTGDPEGELDRHVRLLIDNEQKAGDRDGVVRAGWRGGSLTEGVSHPQDIGAIRGGQISIPERRESVWRFRRCRDQGCNRVVSLHDRTGPVGPRDGQPGKERFPFGGLESGRHEVILVRSASRIGAEREVGGFKRDTPLRRRKSPDDRRGDDDRDGGNGEKRSPMDRANGPGPRPTFVPHQQGAADDKDAAEGSQIDPFRDLERQVLDETRWTDRASGRLDGRPISGGQNE